jgi:hypothetical protein
VSVSTVAKSPALAAPGKGRRLSVPGAKTSFKCSLEFFHGEVIGPVIHAPVESPEERLGEIQPGARRWACSTSRHAGNAPAQSPRHRPHRRGGCSGCRARRTAAGRRQAGQLAVQRRQHEGKDGRLATIRPQHGRDMTVARVQQRQDLACALVAAIGRALATRPCVIDRVRPAAASDAPLLAASTIAARWWSRRRMPRAATRRLNSRSSSFVGERLKHACGRHPHLPAQFAGWLIVPGPTSSRWVGNRTPEFWQTIN